MNFDNIGVESPVRLSRLVRRVTQDNPGPLTASGTNTYIVGSVAPLIIDPGAETELHLRALCGELAPGCSSGVLPTHSHPDHWPLAPRLAAAVGCPVLGYSGAEAFRPDRELIDGEALSSKEWHIRVLHTPGHAADHMCAYLEDEKTLFTGDHVMGWSTTVITRPGGGLRAYLESLERLLALDVKLILPAHGAPVPEPHKRIRDLIEHRLMRTEQILAGLGKGPQAVTALVAAIYSAVDPRLHGLATQSVLAHLDDLIETGRVHELPIGAGASEPRYALASSG